MLTDAQIAALPEFAALAEAVLYTSDDVQDRSVLDQSDALVVLGKVACAPACDDGWLSQFDLSHDDLGVAWGLARAGIIRAEELGTYTDPDGHPIPEWGFALSSEGAAILKLLSIEPHTIERPLVALAEARDALAQARRDTERLELVLTTACEWYSGQTLCASADTIKAYAMHKADDIIAQYKESEQ